MILIATFVIRSDIKTFLTCAYKVWLLIELRIMDVHFHSFSCEQGVPVFSS